MCELQPISLVDVGYDVEQAFKVFMGLVTAAAMALALDALVRDTMGISNHSFVVRSLGSAGYLAVVLTSSAANVKRNDPKSSSGPGD